jgi:AraC family transcriptional regulator, glycine betaine-responsive activator
VFRRKADPQLAAALRREAAFGTRIGAIGHGVIVLAQMGLLEGQACAVPEDQRDSFAERFPNVTISPCAYVREPRATATSGAGVPALLLQMICGDLGQATAARVAAHLQCLPPAGPQQAWSLQAQYGMRNRRLGAVIKIMQSNLETPMTMKCIATTVGISLRQTERLFQRYLLVSPKSYYTRLRIVRAQRLLLQTEMSVTEVANATGFATTSHFARTYQAAFGVSPRQATAISAREASSTGKM